MSGWKGTKFSMTDGTRLNLQARTWICIWKNFTGSRTGGVARGRATVGILVCRWLAGATAGRHRTSRDRSRLELHESTTGRRRSLPSRQPAAGGLHECRARPIHRRHHAAAGRGTAPAPLTLARPSGLPIPVYLSISVLVGGPNVRLSRY